MVTMSRVSDLTHEYLEAVAEAIEERAAIREFDGSETREDAERNARSTMMIFRYRLTDKPHSWHTWVAPCCDLTDARHHLEYRFGERLLDVVEHRP
jgi:hypothetical protein